MFTRSTTLSLVLLTCLAAGLAVAADLPKAETILDKFVTATGGEAAYQKRHSEFSSGTVEIAGTGISGTTLAYHAEPNYSYMEMNFAAIGKVRQGTDGNLVWSVSPAGEAKILEDDARAMHIMAARFNAEIHWRDLYKRVETVGTEDVDGKPAYIVAMTPQQGKPITEFFDVHSSLLVRVIVKEQSATGEVRVESGLSDYRKEGAVLIAHKFTQKAGDTEFIIIRNEYRFNEEPPKGTFDPPVEVKALLDKK